MAEYVSLCQVAVTEGIGGCIIDYVLKLIKSE